GLVQTKPGPVYHPVEVACERTVVRNPKASEGIGRRIVVDHVVQTQETVLKITVLLKTEFPGHKPITFLPKPQSQSGPCRYFQFGISQVGSIQVDIHNLNIVPGGSGK